MLTRDSCMEMNGDKVSASVVFWFISLYKVWFQENGRRIIFGTKKILRATDTEAVFLATVDKDIQNE